MTGTKRLALAAAAAALVGGAGVANAQATNGGFYVKGFGGFTIPQSDNTTVKDLDTGASIDYKLDYKTGYTLGIAGGYAVSPSLAVELEYAYRNADNNDSALGGHVSSNALMANAIYRFNPLGATGEWVPYAGGGIGLANVDLATDTVGDFGRTGQFAYQFIGGIAYNISPQLALTGEARWFSAASGQVNHNGYKADFGLDTVDFLFGAAYAF